jgi:diguanylate cyclase (GGDEF)-like protein/PAS domain S-box-containing protein
MPFERDPVDDRAGFFSRFWRAPAAIAAIGLDGRILACNAAYGEILGVDPDELTGTDSVAFVSRSEVAQAVDQSVLRIQAGRSTENRPQPIRLVRADGATVWVQFDSMLVEDGDDAPYVLATMTDVSHQVEVQQALDQSDSWFRALLQHQSDIVSVAGLDGMIQYISPNCESLLGYSAEDLIGTSGLAHVHPDDVSVLSDGLLAQLDGGVDARPIEYRQRRRDGSWVWLEATARVLPTELGVNAIVVNARDVSERRRAQATVRDAEHRFQSAFATSPLGIAFADLAGRFTWVNRALADAVGETESSLLQKSFFDFAQGADLTLELQDTRRLLRGEIESFSTERRYEHPDGHAIWTRLHFSLVRDANGAPAQLLGQLEDVTERKQHEMQLTHDALHDPLTGLLNRTGLRERVDRAWMARTPDAPLAILFADLDGFKGVNDALGHDAGDEVLVHVASRLRAAVRADDVVSRWGGDEFVVLCPSVGSIADATHIADRMRTALVAPFRVGPGSAHIGISIGVALDDGQPLPDLLIKDADIAAYQAKEHGRNQVVIA